MHLITSRNTDDKPILINLDRITLIEQHQGKVRCWESGHAYHLNEPWSEFTVRIGNMILSESGK